MAFHLAKQVAESFAPSLSVTERTVDRPSKTVSHALVSLLRVFRLAINQLRALQLTLFCNAGFFVLEVLLQLLQLVRDCSNLLRILLGVARIVHPGDENF